MVTARKREWGKKTLMWRKNYKRTGFRKTEKIEFKLLNIKGGKEERNLKRFSHLSSEIK